MSQLHVSSFQIDPDSDSSVNEEVEDMMKFEADFTKSAIDDLDDIFDAVDLLEKYDISTKNLETLADMKERLWLHLKKHGRHGEAVSRSNNN